MKWCSNNNLSPEDLFLFEHAMESIYGFSFFEYISKLLNEIHNTSHDNNNINLKDFEGTVVLDFIQQVAQLPITYNRSFFLEYALFPILKSECLKSQEYRKSAKSLFTHLSFKPAPKSTLVISGLGQITKYLQKLTYIALPLIENLWDVTIDKLNHNNSINLCINTDTYREYIKSNYNKIIKRNSLLFRDDATHSMLYHKFTYETILSSQYERESLNYLLQSYFNVERFNRPHTSLNSAIAPFVYSMEPLTMDHMHNNELNFVNRHIDNILSYAENIYPDK